MVCTAFTKKTVLEHELSHTLVRQRSLQTDKPWSSQKSRNAKMFICSVQINISYNKNAHILRLSFLFGILFASANSHFCVLSMLVRMQINWFCHSRKTGYLIHPIQYILGRLVLFFIFSFPFVVQFDLLSLQIIYNYSKLSKLT